MQDLSHLLSPIFVESWREIKGLEIFISSYYECLTYFPLSSVKQATNLQAC